MDSMSTILADYISADETDRLYIFLSHRDMRGAFMKVDMDRSRGLQKEEAEQSDRRWINRFIQYCPGIFRS